MNDRRMARLGEICRGMGRTLELLGQQLQEEAAFLEEHHERPTGEIPAALPYCPSCGTQQICPKCDIRLMAGSPVDTDAPTERASDLDVDEPDLAQAPSNLGNGPVLLFLDGEDEDPEDEVQVEQSEFTVGEQPRG